MSSLVHHARVGGRLLLGFVAKRHIHAIVQVSNRCNLTCGFCSFWENPARKSDEMTTADFATLSGKLAEAGAMVVSIEGGEPTMRSDIVEIVRAFARHHHPLMATNGWFMTPDLAQRLWDAGLDTRVRRLDRLPGFPSRCLPRQAGHRSMLPAEPSIGCATVLRAARGRCS